MNWMIDGAYGDLYRKAMGFPELRAAQDEWEIERSSGRTPRTVRDPFAGLVQRLAASLAYVRETVRIALTSKETVS
jgi:hypothetical protein